MISLVGLQQNKQIHEQYNFATQYWLSVCTNKFSQNVLLRIIALAGRNHFNHGTHLILMIGELSSIARLFENTPTTSMILFFNSKHSRENFYLFNLPFKSHNRMTLTHVVILQKLSTHRMRALVLIPLTIFLKKYLALWLWACAIESADTEHIGLQYVGYMLKKKIVLLISNADEQCRPYMYKNTH